MTGTLHIAIDTEFMEAIQSSVGKTSLKSDAARIMVYQSESGRTGFDADSAGKALAYLLLADARVCSSSGEVATFSDAQGSFALDVNSFLAKGGHSPVTVVGLSSEMQKAVDEYAEYSNELKLNKLRARYGKPTTEPTKPLLSKLFETDREEYFEAIEALYNLCSRVITLWRPA